MKTLAIAIPLAAVLAIASTVVSIETGVPQVTGRELTYAVTTQDATFDQAVWQAVDNLAQLEQDLTQDVVTFRVEIQTGDDSRSMVHLSFARRDLVRLTSGQVAPEVFLRHYVTFS